YYSRALDLIRHMEEESPVQDENEAQLAALQVLKFEALNGRRAVHFLMGNITEGWQDASALLPLARQMEQNPACLIDALLKQPGVSSAESSEELERGVPLAAEALNLAIHLRDRRREMNCLIAMASQANLLNDPAWVSVGEQALALSREINDRQYEAMILLGLGQAYVGRDELEKGLEYVNAALPVCEALDDRAAEMTLLRVMGAQDERKGDHFHRLVEYEQKRLLIAKEIGDRFEEANSLMFCGQIQALNLGDLEGGLQLLEKSIDILGAVSGKIFPLLRLSQIQIALGQFVVAQQTLETASPVAERTITDLSRVGLRMVKILLYNAIGDPAHLQLALGLSSDIIQMETNRLVSRQYRMAAACLAAAAHIGLSQMLIHPPEQQDHLLQALELSKIAVDIYDSFGYVNIIECASEEILLRRSQALSANGFQAEAAEYLAMANAEMMRKYNHIPPESEFRQTYLENITIHRELRAAYALHVKR
ncbi:MAG TPA: hypothetical protein VF831_06290, partial [Anaerolineales bacterium]